MPHNYNENPYNVKTQYIGIKYTFTPIYCVKKLTFKKNFINIDELKGGCNNTKSRKYFLREEG